MLHSFMLKIQVRHWCFSAGLLFTGFVIAQNQSTMVSKELRVYSFGATIPDKLLENFKTQMGVSVVVHEFNNNEEMLAGLNKNPTGYDVIIATDYAVDHLVKQKALMPLELKSIPNSKNVDPTFTGLYFDPGNGSNEGKNAKYSLPFNWGTTGILYNRSKVKKPITRWADLWRSDLKGHLVVLDDSREMVGMTLLSLGFDKNSTSPAQLNKAKQKLLTLRPSIVGFDSATPENALLEGKAWAGVVFSGNGTLAQRQDKNMEYVFPNDGTGIWFDNMMIPKTALHKDAAVAFIDFVLEPNQSILITQTYPYSTPNRAALAQMKQTQPDLYTAYTLSKITNPPVAIIKAAKAVKDVGSFSLQYENLWNTIKAVK